ncbi:hypothetical protein HYALB_00010276 [Hymenoscyphus albidus]|uniref:Uncharacterized protein n=1 Tax=Hymenoscyphus albidus TaxID=595503 RepID=A0A9N9LVW5_9HELO|nr:hypothetical protein HYALB_00010276 [Hymenoscyphus albidus]
MDLMTIFAAIAEAAWIVSYDCGKEENIAHTNKSGAYYWHNPVHVQPGTPTIPQKASTQQGTGSQHRNESILGLEGTFPETRPNQTITSQSKTGQADNISQPESDKGNSNLARTKSVLDRKDSRKGRKEKKKGAVEVCRHKRDD